MDLVDPEEFLSAADLKWISSRLHRAQSMEAISPVSETWRARYAEDIPILLDALTKALGEIAKRQPRPASPAPRAPAGEGEGR